MLGDSFDAVWHDGNVSDRCTARWESLPVCLMGMATGMHYGSVAVVRLCTTVRCAFKRRRPLWTSSLCPSREMQTMCYHSYFHVPIKRRNILWLKQPAVHIIRHI